MAGLEELIYLDIINVLEEVENDILKERRIFNRLNPFDICDQQFTKLFRLPKQLVNDVIEIVRPYITSPTRSLALGVETKVFTELRFYASGSYQTGVGFNVYTAVSQSSVSRCVADVSAALNEDNIFQRWIKFPNTLQELQTMRNEFHERYNFPGVVGCIDCTHVAIIAPSIDEQVYVNRKGYHSINVQLVCDSSMKILHANARYPGSSNDNFIWNNSSLKDFFYDLHTQGHTNFFLLGDSGYALRSFMMTPIINPEPQPDTLEYRYNTRQICTRTLIERCNGLLKMRFRCLLKHRVLHYKPEVACKIINACIVLHNMCIINNVAEPQDSNDNEIDLGIILGNDENNAQPMRRVNPELAKGRAVQQKLIRYYFTY